MHPWDEDECGGGGGEGEDSGGGNDGEGGAAGGTGLLSADALFADGLFADSERGGERGGDASTAQEAAGQAPADATSSLTPADAALAATPKSLPPPAMVGLARALAVLLAAAAESDHVPQEHAAERVTAEALELTYGQLLRILRHTCPLALTAAARLVPPSLASSHELMLQGYWKLLRWAGYL